MKTNREIIEELEGYGHIIVDPDELTKKELMDLLKRTQHERD